ncbi:penicillin-binding protein 2 [Photobacterium damselae]|uniref:penicillin-binding protein 2 n=1 Tax=Photobacterium damselae TaxID=38293 RepID=UPI001EED5FE8|nr:penicillin-binding protein 2 [Photobacterium damselae]UKA04506.1 penicillin-binding protein 2 [Photobacterium damselae subsp. damselae]
MKHGDKVRSRKVEKKVMNGRVLCAAGIMTIATAILTYNVFNVSVLKHEKESQIAKNNALKTIEISPTRGDILDRNGAVLATTRPSYDLAVTPEKIPNYMSSSDRKEAVISYLDILGKFVPISPKERDWFVKKIIRANSYSRVTLINDLSSDELSTVMSNMNFLDGVSIIAKRIRTYPYKGVFLSDIGYVSRANQEDLDKARADGRKLVSDAMVGKMGIEKLYDDKLYGKAGTETVALNARGRVVERQISRRPVNGESIKLTIDAGMQNLAYQLMNGRKGAVVVMDARNGDLLTALSTSTLDQNQFVLKTPENSKVNMLDKSKPLYNRFLRGQYPIASTMKVFMSLIGLEGKFIDPDKKVWSGAYYSLGGYKFRDWDKRGHGWIDLHDAIEQSSDVYFYKLAREMGIDYIHDSLSEFGFGKKTGANIGYESSGLLPSQDWKRRVKHEPWYDGETLSVGIGQGYFLATPLQLAVAASTIASGGNVYVPNIILGQGNNIKSHLNLEQDDVRRVLSGMRDVVYGKRGTARRLKRIAEIQMGGKTGTAQVFSTFGTYNYKAKDVKESLRDHAIFLGIAPIEHPEIVIVVIVENGGFGAAAAAPIAQKLANYYSEHIQTKPKPKLIGIGSLEDNQDAKLDIDDEISADE